MNPEIKLSKLKPIDYDEINNITNTYKQKCVQSSQKMNNLLKRSKLGKDNNRRIEHKKIWNLESMRLNKKKRKLQRKINNFLNSNCSHENSENLIMDLYQLNDNIMSDHFSFKSNIIDPVWILCEDIKEYIAKKSRGEKIPGVEPIKKLVELTKIKLKDVMFALKSEEESLLSGFQNEIDRYYTVVNSDNIHDRVGTGIPMDAWDIDCFDKTFLTEMLSQFLNLDVYFQAKLENMNEEAVLLNKRISSTIWTSEKIEISDYLQEMYVLHATIDRNLLLQDIMRIMFPLQSKTDMNDIENYIRSKRFLKEKIQSLFIDWKHDREELFIKIKASIIDFNEQMILDEVESQKIKMQKSICSKLTKQVNDWQLKKEEMRSLQEILNQEIEEKAKQEEMEKLKKEAAHRKETKQMIFQYKLERNLQSEKVIEENRRKVEELREELQRQSIIDQERINFREILRQEKIREEQAKKEHLLKQQQLTEMKLNQLAEQVCPLVESDPERVLKPTQTWLHHTEELTEKLETDNSNLPNNKSTNRYSLPLNTFTDKDILSNPRFCVEKALRDAGLINNDYARNILKTIPTNQAPRKDCNLSDINFLRYE